MDIEQFAEQVRSKEEFEEFLRLLVRDYEENGADWENQTLREFLEGLIGFANDMEGYYDNRRQSIDSTQPTWRIFSELLLAARVYE